MEDMIKEENILKVKNYIKQLENNNYDLITYFNSLLNWININSINLNYEELIALINTDDNFKKMVFDICSLDKINYDNLNLNQVTFIKNMIRAYKRVQEINSEEISIIEKELENFKLEDIKDNDININTMESNPLSFYLSQSRDRLLTKEEVIDLCKKRDQGSQKAREILAEYNLRLVASIAIKYKNTIEHSNMIQGIDIMDLVSSGNEGLMLAIDKYNYKLGWNFSTYASWWIMWSIRKTLAKESRTIRVPVAVHEESIAINKAISKYYVKYRMKPSEEELAEMTKLPLNRVKDALQLLNNMTLSLNAPVKNEEDCYDEIVDFVEDKYNSNEAFERNLLYEQFREALNNSKLTYQEQIVIKNRFGFTDGEIHTLEEIGKHLGVTRERVRQIENKAISKLKRDYKIIKFK